MTDFNGQAKHRRNTPEEGRCDSGEQPVPVEAAVWYLELRSTCPHCHEDVDLMDYADFWESGITACENHTDRSNQLHVVCPECSEEFDVCCEY